MEDAEIRGLKRALAAASANGDTATVAQLRAKLDEGYETVVEPPTETTGEVDEDEAEEVGSPYDGLTKAELQRELESRGLPKSGARDDLQARLEADDASEEE